MTPVQVLDEIDGCLAGVDPREAEHARRRCVAVGVDVPVGRWSAPVEPGRTDGWLGLIVIGGLMTRTIEVEGLRAKELLGPGDIMRPWDKHGDAEVLPASAVWQALEPTSVAVLDRRFAATVAQWPSVASALLRAALQRGNGKSLLLALARARRADDRLMLLFRHLADRWGRVRTDGVHVPLHLTHVVLGELACLRRPTVSSTLASLREAGTLQRLDDGTWLLPHADVVAAAA